jgi:hypothetical protein
MKTITGLLITYALVVPPAPAAAQDFGRQIERIVDNALTLAADSLDDLVDAREARAARQRGARGRADRGPEYTDTFERTVRLGRNGRLGLENLSGNVEITGTSGDEVRITATKVTNSTSEATARDALRAMDVAVIERPGSVTISARPTRGRSTSVDVNYVISVPAGTNLELKTYSGDVTIRSMEGDIRLTSYSGDVVVSDSKPSAVEIDAKSGDVSLEQVDSERVQVGSLSGDVVFKGKLSKAGRYELSTNSGDVQVVTDRSASFELEARTFSGDISSDFAMKLGTLPSSFAGGRGARRNNDIRGVVNDGGPLLSLHSLSGDILITRR